MIRVRAHGRGDVIPVAAVMVEGGLRCVCVGGVICPYMGIMYDRMAIYGYNKPSW